MPLHAAPTAHWGSHGDSILTRIGVSPAPLSAGRNRLLLRGRSWVRGWLDCWTALASRQSGNLGRIL